MKPSVTMEGIIRGMGVMLFFGIGTIPALLLVAKLVDMGWLKKKRSSTAWTPSS